MIIEKVRSGQGISLSPSLCWEGGGGGGDLCGSTFYTLSGLCSRHMEKVTTTRGSLKVVYLHTLSFFFFFHLSLFPKIDRACLLGDFFSPPSLFFQPQPLPSLITQKYGYRDDEKGRLLCQTATPPVGTTRKFPAGSSSLSAELPAPSLPPNTRTNPPSPTSGGRLRHTDNAYLQEEEKTTC